MAMRLPEYITGGLKDRVASLASVIERVGGEIVADSVGIAGAPRLDKRFTTSLIAQSNQELLQEVDRIRQTAIKDVETRTGRTVAGLLDQLKTERSSPSSQSIVTRLRGTLLGKLNDEERIAITSLTGTRIFDSIKTIEPLSGTAANDIRAIDELISPLVSKTSEQFIYHIKSIPRITRQRLYTQCSLKAIGTYGRSIYGPSLH